MSLTLLLAHGWGYDATFWTPLLSCLPSHTAYRIEAGHLGTPPVWPSVPPGTLAIGHSAGVPALLACLPPGCIGLIAINGFTRFVAAADFPGVPARLPARMLSRLATHPTDTVRDFRARCGDALVPARVSRDRLHTGLQALRDADERDRLDTLDLPVLALAALDDPIVLPSHARACFSDDFLQWSQTGGHLLPLTRPDWCAQRIAAFPC